MTIDQPSTNIIKIALYIDKDYPGFVSELWLDEALKAEIKSSLPTTEELPGMIIKTQQLIAELSDTRRKRYLTEILNSLSYQVKALDDPSISFSEFSKYAYGFEMKRVSHQEIIQIESDIKGIERKLGLSRQEVYKKCTVAIDSMLPQFEKYIQQAKSVLPNHITDFPDKGFTLEPTTSKPWSAFNSHIAPFSSKLTLNTDVQLTDADLHHLAFHEAYGGHHSELSQKDKLLLEGRGEHGLVITFSPQTFISEAVAEGVYSIFNDQQDSLESQMIWNYNRLTFALQNLATYLFFDDKKTREEIDLELKQYAVSEKTRENILNFSTDQLFGRYAPVYYTAHDFFINLYQGTNKKDALLKTLFTQPCTPIFLVEEFLGKKILN